MSQDDSTFVVITSIFPPTEAVRAFAAYPSLSVVVVGDRKSPIEWESPGVRFLSAMDQAALPLSLPTTLPYNHYARKMVGYLWAIKHGAAIIYDSDDDNIPKASWSLLPFDGAYRVTPRDRGFLNIYKLYTDQPIWPRGFDLRLIQSPLSHLPADDLRYEEVRVGIWQGLADGDPDVDAIYRLTNNTPCYFRDELPVVLQSGSLCPFNSQNTAFRSELFPLLYLPCTVTFRFTDILRGLVAQPIMWRHGYRLGFTNATVVQERNPHDYLRDLESEIPCYLQANRVVEVVTAAIRDSAGIDTQLVQAYTALRNAGIVQQEELYILSMWLKDLADLGQHT